MLWCVDHKGHLLHLRGESVASADLEPVSDLFLQRAAMLALQVLYYANSVRLSVCHMLVLCQNDCT